RPSPDGPSSFLAVGGSWHASASFLLVESGSLWTGKVSAPPYASCMTCPACGGVVVEGQRVCPACGHQLVTRGDGPRVATVLFADLVGFTSLSETRDPEQVKYLVDRCFERMVRDITSYGGRVDKIVGDAILALFGAPVAHEDDADRAVRAALRMQQTL